MSKFYVIELDGIDGCDTLYEYEVDGVETTDKIMFDDVRGGLKELGGGHADIWDADTDEFYAEIEV